MIVYISGRTTGDENYLEKFTAAADELRKNGHVVLNPAMLPPGLRTYDDYMNICFPMIDACDTVVMLDGWQASSGAVTERKYAIHTGKLVCGQKNLERYIQSFGGNRTFYADGES